MSLFDLLESTAATNPGSGAPSGPTAAAIDATLAWTPGDSSRTIAGAVSTPSSGALSALDAPAAEPPSIYQLLNDRPSFSLVPVDIDVGSSKISAVAVAANVLLLALCAPLRLVWINLNTADKIHGA